MGSILKDYGNGKYRVQICNGFKPDGKVNRITKTITAKNKTDLDKQIKELEVDFKRGNVQKSAPEYTFADLVSKWTELEMPKLGIKTMERYDEIISKHMMVAFQNRKLKTMCPLDIEEYLHSLTLNGCRLDEKKGGYSQKTILHHYVILNRLLNLAVRWDYMEKNPCDKVDKPKVDTKEAKYYDDTNIQKLLQALELEEKNLDNQISESVKYKRIYSNTAKEKSIAKRKLNQKMRKLYVLIAIVTGCRRSEVLGLEWQDIDTKNGMITLVRTSQYDKEKGIYTVNKLKDGSSTREITIPEELCVIIEEYKQLNEKCRKIMGSEWEYSDRLFISIKGGKNINAGTAMRPDVISQWFDRFLKKYGLPEMNLHGLRHTCISYLLNKGMDIQSVAERAGHGSISMIEKTYGHVFEKNKRKCANQFKDIF